MSNKGKSVSKNKLICGVGLNDSKYPVLRRDGDKKYTCPKYAIWTRMLSRCYDAKTHNRQPSYIGCSVCDEWLIFSNFCAWLDDQDWKGKQLDKDLINRNNKLYSPDNCVFVSMLINTFITNGLASRGKYPLWVYFHKGKQKFYAKCRNPFTIKPEFLGLYTDAIQAHKIGQAKKHEHALKLASLENNPVIIHSLENRYSPQQNWLSY